jgi:hypothetical protein
MTIKWKSYTNPVYMNLDGTAIDCQLILIDDQVWPFTACSYDIEPHGVEIFNTIISNQKTVPIAPYVAPVVNSNPAIITLSDFMARFTSDESSAIATSAHTNLTVLLWVTKMSTAKTVNLNDPAIIAGIETLATAGVLSQTRVTEILSTNSVS